MSTPWSADEREVSYINYEGFRAEGMPPSTLRAFYGNLTDALEKRYQFERHEAQINAGARLADDHFCPGCGARGYRYHCGRCC